MGKKSSDKKRKAAADAPAEAAGFSLFGGKKDTELDGVFSASVRGLSGCADHRLGSRSRLRR